MQRSGHLCVCVSVNSCSGAKIVGQNSKGAFLVTSEQENVKGICWVVCYSGVESGVAPGARVPPLLESNCIA